MHATFDELSTGLIFLAIAGLLNCSLFVLSVKWKVWERARTKECAFCLFFWLTLTEGIFVLPEEYTLRLWIIPIALAGSTAGVIFLSFYGNRDFE